MELCAKPPSEDPPPTAAVLADAPQRLRRRRSWRRLVPWIMPALLVGAYLAVALWQLPTHRYQINPDGVSYIAIARQYAAGHFADAVSAYWSPLYSWLMVPTLWMGLPPLYASKIVGIGIGAATLIGMLRLMRAVEVQGDVRLIVGLAAIPLIVDAVYIVTTPDLLVGTVLLFYLTALCRPAPSADAPAWPRDVRIGLLGALAFLAKAYALPFVIAHLLLVRALALLRRRANRPRLLWGGVITFVAGGAVVAAWAAVLTHKYGYVTAGSTARYNLRVDGPGSPGQVMHFAGFLPPPSPTGLSAWDDITPYIELLPRWNPLTTQTDRAFLWQRIQNSRKRLFALMEQSTAWFLPILAAMVLLAGARADLRPRRPGVILAAAAVLYPCGYLPLHVEPRFLVPLLLMLLVGAAYAISRASSRGLLSGFPRRVAVAAVVGATFVGQPNKSLEQSRDSGAVHAKLAQTMRGVIPVGSRIASERRWGDSLYLAFYLDLQFLGERRPGSSSAQLRTDLEAVDAQYYLVWRKHRRAPAGWIEVAADLEKPFALYRRVESPPQP